MGKLSDAGGSGKWNKSDWTTVRSGVSQASVLGSLLLIFYMNDLDYGITSDINKITDDTKHGQLHETAIRQYGRTN